MNAQARKVRYFFFSQDFSDALRITLAVLLPGALLGWLGQLGAGVTVALGALCISITDSPGPVVHRRNGMLAGILLLPGLALLTGLVQPYIWLQGAGNRGAELCVYDVSGLRQPGGFRGLGRAAAGHADDGPQPHAAPAAGATRLQVTAGGVWYLLVSLLWYQIRPYRLAQQALGECVQAIAGFLRLKAEFYRTGTRLDDDFRRLMAQQVTVSEKQDAVRELLFKTRQMVKESTGTGRRLVLTFVDAVDLYEHITVSYFRLRRPARPLRGHRRARRHCRAGRADGRRAGKHRAGH